MSRSSVQTRTCSTSSQSFGRSKTALHTIKCSGARTGRRCLAERHGTDGAAHRRVDIVVGEEEVERGAAPRQRHWPSRSSARLIDRVDAERSERCVDGGVLRGRDEHVEVDVDRGAWLGVVGQRQRAAEGVPDPDAGETVWIATILSGSDGSLTPSVGGCAGSAAGSRAGPRPRGRRSASSSRSSSASPRWRAASTRSTRRPPGVVGRSRRDRSSERDEQQAPQRRPRRASRRELGEQLAGGAIGRAGRDRRAGAQAATRWPPGIERLPARARARSITSGVSSLNVASVRLRGPAAWSATRAAPRSRTRGTTYAIVGIIATTPR